MLRQARNLVEIVLYQCRVEARQTLGRHYLLVVNHLNLGIFSVEPFGLLVVGHDEYLAYPRRIHLYRAQTVFQFAAVSISALAVFLSFCGPSDARIAFSLPLRVIAINP